MTDYDEPTPRSYSRGEYRGMLNYESIIGGHITQLMQARDVNDTQYVHAIETLIIHCPKDIRRKSLAELTRLGLRIRDHKQLTADKLLIYDELLMYINELLEAANLIFRTGTFEVGHD